VKGLGGQGQAKRDARFMHRNGSMSSGVHEEIGVLFGKADILSLGAPTSQNLPPKDAPLVFYWQQEQFLGTISRNPKRWS
jgi:hypothetical protein